MAIYTKRPGLASIAVIMLLALAGCTFRGEQTAAQDNVRDDLAMRLVEAQQAHAAALDLWDRLIFGEQLTCQTYISVPEPLALSTRDLAAHPEADAIQTRINAAIPSLRTSATLWDTECLDARVYVPVHIAQEGRTAALAAGDPLVEASALLAAWTD
jgi:hypothetical protein